MNLLETIKKPFLLKEPKYKPSSDINKDKIEYEVQIEDPETFAVGFKDEGTSNDFYYNRAHRKWEALVRQKLKIESYREAFMTPEVSDGVDDIINEASFSEQREDIVKLDIDETNDKIKDALADEFKNVCDNVLNLDENIFTLMEKFYVDGQLNCRAIYDNRNLKDAIKKIEVITPFYFYFDEDIQKWRYLDVKLDNKGIITSVKQSTEVYDKEEIIHVDSGMYDSENNIILGWLDKSIKSVNQLKTLEDLLIPMRFSRSVSRRVFNVDVGDLTPGKAETYLNKVKNEFKYKKHYNTETGKIKNQQHIASMVEDYWFANRNGAKGTVVDVLDETGNLGELEDLLYFQKKIFRSMKIPSSRALRGDDGGTFGPNNEEISQEEMKFYLFVMRFRKRFMMLIKRVYKRNVIAKGIMTAVEFNDYRDKLTYYFSGENKFFIKMRQMEMVNQQDMFMSIKEDMGPKGIYSYEYIFKTIFNMSKEEMDERLKDITTESKSKSLKDRYTIPEEDF